jgi:photosystem II stability/assembly factor-like uncharacterized protein
MARRLRVAGEVALLSAALWAVPAAAQAWRAMGPPGGDVRALAADPHDSKQLYLGTTDGHIFGSTDGGERWEILGRAGAGQDGVVTAILVDPRNTRTLYAAIWTLNPQRGGGVYRSDDAGRTWRAAGLEGQAVRALAQAESNPNILVAGTLDGVYRTRDATRTWERISPAGHGEIRNLDSLALDPRNPDIIYAGTYHLPWKTTDGGRTWAAIHTGMIDDSDVMSILVDRTNPRRIYAGACTGIYRSDNAGARWRKIQGIPLSARRTHVIRQDPRDPQTVYAGTTEGLWKSSSGGAAWRRMTPPGWVINALVIDAQGPARLVMGTERGGVLVSNDGGATFRAANHGFNHRQILALALDRERPGRLLAVLANAPEPVLATDDGGATWAPLGPGLNTEKLLRVYATPGSWLAALQSGGLAAYDAEKKSWKRVGALAGEAAERKDKRGRVVRHRGPRPLDLRVEDMAFSHEAWFAATPAGLLVSHDAGATWSLVRTGPVRLPVRSVRVSRDGRELRVVSMRGMVFSRDGGDTWTWHDLPYEAGGALRLDVADENTLLAAAGKGLYISRDAGKSWQLAAAGLPDAPLQDLAIVGDTFLVSMQTGGLYISYDCGRTWTRIEGTLAEGYFPVVTSRDAAAVIFAASSTDGLYAVELRGAAASGTNGNPK